MKGGLSRLLQIRDEEFRIESFPGLEIRGAVDFPDHHAMRRGESLGKFMLEDGAARGVRAGLEEGPET